MHRLAQLDHDYIWHPFTQMRDWLHQEPITIVAGKGASLYDVRGREYLDANASIWTNLHGHAHPKINAAITRQLRKIAHSSALGLANEPASLLAERLVKAAHPRNEAPRRKSNPPGLAKVFYSDDGATAMEVALKLAYEFARRTGRHRRPRFLSLAKAYHGDTIGVVSLSHIDLFHRAYAGLLFKSDTVMAPYCYRCPFNRAKPEPADARAGRQCRWQCVDQVEQQFAKARRAGKPYAAMVVEPLIQGAAGMIPQPPGWLQRVAQIVRANGALLIADEVMTGFGRTTDASDPLPGSRPSPSLFACHREGVQPDFMAVAKGLTGGYLPLAATLTTQPVFEAFLGDYSEFKTFFHGHSYTANQLGCAAALASLDLLERPSSASARARLAQSLRASLAELWVSPAVGDIRQVGLIAGIELVRNRRTRVEFDVREQAGIRVCQAMARRGVLTRPIGNVIALMPPYCMTKRQVYRMISSLRESIEEVFK